MATREFKHFGVPTSTVQPNEQFIDGAKVYVTNPDDDPFCVEFLRFAPDSPMPKEIQTQAHAAFLVPSLDQELVGKNVLIPPFDATPELRCAFIKHGDAIIEVMEKRK